MTRDLADRLRFLAKIDDSCWAHGDTLNPAADRLEQLEKMVATEEWIHAIAVDARADKAEALAARLLCFIETLNGWECDTTARNKHAVECRTCAARAALASAEESKP